MSLKRERKTIKICKRKFRDTLFSSCSAGGGAFPGGRRGARFIGARGGGTKCRLIELSVILLVHFVPAVVPKRQTVLYPPRWVQPRCQKESPTWGPHEISHKIY